jgi:diguanylate cyclase (GGDEF)-like protein
MPIVGLTARPQQLVQRARASVALLFLGAMAALCPVRTLAAGAPEMVFARLGSDQGLAQGTVNAIVQDGEGFMWFGTEDGLDRFDGYEIRHFTHRRGVAGSLPNNWIAALARDSTGRLWVGMDGGGLVWRDVTAGQFRAPAVYASSTPLDPTTWIRAQYVDHSGRIWVATRGAGVFMLDLVHQKTRAFRRDLTNPDSLSDDSVYSFAEDPFGQIWIGTANGLDRLDPESGHIEQFGARLRAATAASGTPAKVNALHADSRGILWVGLDSGLVRFDVPAADFKFLRHSDGDPDTLPAGRVTTLLVDSAQRLWVGTSAGLALLDRRTDRCVVFRHNPSNGDSLPDSNIVSLYEDRSGLLWIGTKAGGIASWNPRSWSFGHHRFGEEGADNITSFAVDGRGTLWVGSYNAGVASIDPQSGVVRRYRRRAHSALALHDDAVMAMVTDKRNRLWIGTMSAGIDRLDPARGDIKHFDQRPDDAASLPASGVMSLLRDARDRIWVGTYGGGLARIDPDTDQVTRYPHGREDTGGLSGDRATALAEDRNGLIWIGTDGSGLNVLDPATGRALHYFHDARDPKSLSANTIYALHVDESGVVWVGTRGGGLDRVVGAPFAKEQVRFENLSESDGLPNSSVYGIESDASGRLWVSTNRGLAVVNAADRSVRSFRRSHGLQGDEFNFGAHLRAPDGTLYFGGANGYNAFLPERLQANTLPPPVVFTEVLKLNRPVSQTPEGLKSLELGFRDAVITFRFSALDFTGPAENRYQYRLEGFDADWVNGGAARQATYTNLDGGSYVFRVRAANSDGRWSEVPLSLPLHVSPAPWLSWWARTLYVLGAGALVFLVWFGQHRRLQREAAYAERLKAEVSARTAELAERNSDMEKANHQLREASVSDSLTGLGNRRCLRDAMALLPGTATDASAAHEAPCVLMVVDLDFLKPINDQFGHEGGDAVLIQVAEILRRVFRSVDLIVRWGGDEFVVLCKNADLATASALAERVRSSVAKQIFRISDGLVARTSCSIGFAPVPLIPGHWRLLDWEQSLRVADAALYEAKHERNTWVGWGGTDKAAQLPNFVAALAADSAGLEQGGYLVVRRRPSNSEDTVDSLRVPRRPGNT